MSDMTRPMLEQIVTDCVGKRRGAGPAVDAIMLAADQYAAEIAFQAATAVVTATAAVAARALLAREAAEPTAEPRERFAPSFDPDGPGYETMTYPDEASP